MDDVTLISFLCVFRQTDLNPPGKFIMFYYAD